MRLCKSLEQKRLRRSSPYLYDTVNFDEAVYAQEIAQDRRERLRNSGSMKLHESAGSSDKFLRPFSAASSEERLWKKRLGKDAKNDRFTAELAFISGSLEQP